MRRLVAVVVLLIVASVAATVAKQEPTLTSMKDVARRLGGTATNKIDVESPSMSLSELVTLSDLIIHARLDGVTTHLSDDESMVFRDFVVTPIVIIKQPPGLAQASKPGPLPALTVRQVGGRLVIDGLTLVTTTNFEDPDNSMGRRTCSGTGGILARSNLGAIACPRHFLSSAAV